MGEATLFGIFNLGKACGLDADVGVPGLSLDCLKVMRGPGGGIPCSSRLRLAEAAAASLVRVVRTLADLKKRKRPCNQVCQHLQDRTMTNFLSYLSEMFHVPVPRVLKCHLHRRNWVIQDSTNVCKCRYL